LALFPWCCWCFRINFWFFFNSFYNSLLSWGSSLF